MTWASFFLCCFIGLGLTDATYVVYQDVPLAWSAANAACGLQGGMLATVRSASDQDVLEQVMAAAIPTAYATRAWIGGFKDDDTYWHWPDGSIFSDENGNAHLGAYQNWGNNEPNGFRRMLQTTDLCMEVWRTTNFDFNGAWNDRSCTLNQPYVCEIPPPSPPASPPPPSTPPPSPSTPPPPPTTFYIRGPRSQIVFGTNDECTLELSPGATSLTSTCPINAPSSRRLEDASNDSDRVTQLETRIAQLEMDKAEMKEQLQLLTIEFKMLKEQRKAP